jgi:acyl-CoA synthetase (AMP-forming)/AMP-acid ligase II
MASTPALTERAAARAAERQVVYRAGGSWEARPIDLVAEAAADSPERVAVVDRSGSLTYAELDAAVSAAGARLRSWGATESSPVLLVVGNDAASVIAIHAALRIGAVAMVAPASAGSAQLADIVEQTAPAVVVGPGSSNGWQALDELRSAPAVARLPIAPRPADEPAVVIFTSGTTSRPKGVIHSLGTLLVATRNYIERAELGRDERLFVVSPVASVTGILQAITVTPRLRAQVILESKWDAAATCDLLLETEGTFFGGPDLLLDRLLDQVKARGIHDVSIEAVYLGGTMLDPRVLSRIEDFGIVVMRAYGSSEAPISTGSGRGEPPERRLADDGPALGDVEVRIGSRNDPGECCIRGPHLFLGYVHEEDDAHAFDDGWFCTGDVADLAEGRLRITGRIRDVVIRNGLKIPISEVEGHLGALPGIERSAGFAVPDGTTGERLAVGIIASDGHELRFEDVIAGLTAAGLAKWKLPEELVVWDEPFPENATGKVLRNRLEELSAGRPRLLASRLRAEA